MAPLIFVCKVSAPPRAADELGELYSGVSSNSDPHWCDLCASIHRPQRSIEQFRIQRFPSMIGDGSVARDSGGR